MANGKVGFGLVLQVLFLLVGFALVRGAVHHIAVENFRFDADDNNSTQIDTLTINVMDTVQWDWVEGFHTVTSGLSSSPGDNPGELFDAPSDPNNLTFRYQFSSEGDFPYFCRPHEFLNMKGVIRVQGGAGIDDGVSEGGVRLPASFSLSQNYPNPFNPVTTITFQIASVKDATPGTRSKHSVSLVVFDLRGRKIRTLLRDVLPSGQWSVVWDGRGDLGEAVGSGTYIYRLSVDDQVVSRKMILAR